MKTQKTFGGFFFPHDMSLRRGYSDITDEWFIVDGDYINPEFFFKTPEEALCYGIAKRHPDWKPCNLDYLRSSSPKSNFSSIYRAERLLNSVVIPKEFTYRAAVGYDYLDLVIGKDNSYHDNIKIYGDYNKIVAESDFFMCTYSDTRGLLLDFIDFLDIKEIYES